MRKTLLNTHRIPRFFQSLDSDGGGLLPPGVPATDVWLTPDSPRPASVRASAIVEGAALMDALDNYRSQRRTVRRKRGTRWFLNILYPFITLMTHQEAFRRGFEKCWFQLEMYSFFHWNCSNTLPKIMLFNQSQPPITSRSDFLRLSFELFENKRAQAIAKVGNYRNIRTKSLGTS